MKPTSSRAFGNLISRWRIQPADSRKIRGNAGPSLRGILVTKFECCSRTDAYSRARLAQGSSSRLVPVRSFRSFQCLAVVFSGWVERAGRNSLAPTFSAPSGAERLSFRTVRSNCLGPPLLIPFSLSRSLFRRGEPLPSRGSVQRGVAGGGGEGRVSI